MGVGPTFATDIKVRFRLPVPRIQPMTRCSFPYRFCQHFAAISKAYTVARNEAGIWLNLRCKFRVMGVVYVDFSLFIGLLSDTILRGR